MLACRCVSCFRYAGLQLINWMLVLSTRPQVLACQVSPVTRLQVCQQCYVGKAAEQNRVMESQVSVVKLPASNLDASIWSLSTGPPFPHQPLAQRQVNVVVTWLLWA